MAEQIPYAVAASLVNRLASAAFREFGRIYGVMDELERLKNTVESIKAVLLDAEDKQEKSHAVQIWIRRLKDDVLHPADDLLDEFAIEDMRQKRDEARKNKVTQVLHSLSPNRIAFSRKMAYEVEKIQKKFNDVVKDMSVLNLNPNVVVVQQTNSVRREKSSFVLESDIIGRDDDKNDIVSMLRQSHENQRVSVVAIVGIGGLGKTALSQLVYNDGEVTNYFEKCMWVCVSDNFDVKTIVKNMLESLTKEPINDTLSLENLQNMLRENLTGKKYLLVLDDIWNESFGKWAQLRTYLMYGAKGSKVVVTTRSKIVAERMGVSVSYNLNGLTLEKSWSLLTNIITYGDETKAVNQTLETIGKKIAEKCSGVPLAIRTLGGLLQGKNEEREWIDVLQGDFWKLCEDEESIMPVLKLSYQNLSPQLRQCFAYCSLYTKDWKIEKDELIQLWMAQGYLECSDEKQRMEDIGNQFVTILLMKSFFQDAEIYHGDIRSFKMHDLSMKVAGNDCCYLDSETKRLVGSPMHIMLKRDAIGFLESLSSNKMRTLILLTDFSEKLNEKELLVISKFKYLRVLKLMRCSLSNLCDSIEKLNHLRYLNLQECEVVGSLSTSISNLVCLQTLLLHRCKVEFSTIDISKLISLRYFDIEYLKHLNRRREHLDLENWV
ncbi:putative P-loop containing nucleoside triphosphate hydrolase, leucine-rich repeat domain, L [Medicago truncatula]|uniref:Putative P-loop containing nucleoside triphosphate hydrolase, leucine-rich repeat domain, L n=1 Tax=Medicago truncatula TaxID=3880 RepID=A0A396GFD3_MEDTR|nr:putative disease resistance protein RGA1 [Medicago truncatula]RHN38951.1 putative P-loop containing nucleoside triphosphate hydrolase, leucine-rich repeat domain, L [Medicago truncatula]